MCSVVVSNPSNDTPISSISASVGRRHGKITASYGKLIVAVLLGRIFSRIERLVLFRNCMSLSDPWQVVWTRRSDAIFARILQTASQEPLRPFDASPTFITGT